MDKKRRRVLGMLAAGLATSGCSQLTGSGSRSGNGTETDATTGAAAQTQQTTVQSTATTKTTEDGRNQSTPTPTPTPTSTPTPIPAELSDWQRRRPIIIDSEHIRPSYPVTIDNVDIGASSPNSIRIYDAKTGTIIPHAVREFGDKYEVAFKAKLTEGKTIDRYYLYDGNPGAADESDQWPAMRNHWYAGFEDEPPGSKPSEWSPSFQTTPQDYRIDCKTASRGNCSLFIDGRYDGNNSSLGAVRTVEDRRYTKLVFSLNHVNDITKIQLTNSGSVTSDSGFQSYQIKNGELTGLCTGGSAAVSANAWLEFQFDFTWEGGNLGWDLRVDGRKVDSCSPDEHKNIAVLSGIIFTQGSSGSGQHYIDDVRFLAEVEEPPEISLGTAQQV